MERSIYNQKDFAELIERINKLTPSSTPVWGKMNVGQMLAHTNLVFEQALGTFVPSKRSPRIMGWLLKPLLLSKKPFSKNSPTGPDFRMTETKNFEQEKRKIIANATEVNRRGPNTELMPHTLIGKLSSDEWGWLLWKHTDHHLRQFGV